MKYDIEKIVEMYSKLGEIITNESVKFKNKLGSNGLESSDLETLYSQMEIRIGELHLMRETIEEILVEYRQDSI